MFEFINDHDRNCEYRRTAAMGLAYECEHGHAVCPICDPCTCPRPQPELLSSADPEFGTGIWPAGTGGAIGEDEITDPWDMLDRD